jgi:H/ACA ribonucleoprotein complex subunit 4
MWLTRSEEETDERFGKRPEERSIEEMIPLSVVIVDKHSGPTSSQITQWTKEILGVNKAGHSGTLDPAVTGVLPVALGHSVKAMPLLVGLEKEYVGVMHLHREVDGKVLREEAAKFIGKIKQLVPKKSAVARRVREREIFYFDIVEIEGRNVLFKAGVEAGTYIRKLVHDLGQSLGFGAHMTELRRTKVGSFDEKNSFSLVGIKDSYEFWKSGDSKLLRKILIPIEHAVDISKKVFVKDSAVDAVCNGSPVYPIGVTRVQEGLIAGENVGIFTLKDELVAIGIAKMDAEKIVKAKRGVAVRTDRVIMQKGIYPSSWKGE